jgi:pimeloyl-ACP methyl ester carboxylesterase
VPRLAAALIGVLLGWAVVAEAADPLAGLSVSKTCLDFVQKRMLGDAVARLVFGHLYYAHDPATSRATCGWSASSAYGSYAACVRETQKAAIAGPCLPLIADAAVVAGSYAQARSQAGADAWELTMASDPLRCGQEPGNRFYWLEYGFCDLKPLGPEPARGVIIWNHGIAGTQVQHTAPPALALRLLQARGWDVLKLNRHNLSEGADSYRRAEERVLEEIKTQRERGYKRIVIAGQSFGGRVALEVGVLSPDLFATVAMAPGMETTVGNSRTQAPTDERLQRSKSERVAVVFPGKDELFGNPDRGKTAGPVLAARGRPYLMLDERSGLSGHGGGTGGNFVLRYGRCLEEFLSAAAIPAGAFTCPAAGGGWSLARELLPKLPGHVKVLAGPEGLPADLAAVGGLWYGILGESIVLWAMVDSGGAGPSLVFAWVSSASNRGGGVYPAAVEGREIKAALQNRAVLSVKPKDGRRLEITWTPVAAESNFSITARRVEPLVGELLRVDAAD